MGCEKVSLPDYWYCSGSSQQRVSSSVAGQAKFFEGSNPVLLEVFDGQVTQYISKPFTGVFEQCLNNATELIFQLPSCAASVSSSSESHINVSGNLIKESGKLTLKEVKDFSSEQVQTTGTYSCKYLGHRYPASVFYANETP